MTKEQIKDTPEYKFLEKITQGYNVSLEEYEAVFTLYKPCFGTKPITLIINLWYEDRSILLRKLKGTHGLPVFDTTYHKGFTKGWIGDPKVLGLIKRIYKVKKVINDD